MSSLEIKKNSGKRFIEIGARLKAVRERLGYTLDRMSFESNTSRSYIAESESGRRLPPTKYLLFLNDQFRVRMDFIFVGDGDMFPNQEETTLKRLQFGPLKKEVMEMLELIDRFPHALYAVLGHFAAYRINNEKLINLALESGSDI